MSETIIREWYFWLYSVITGVCFAYVYDNLRLFRRLWKHRRWLVDLEDVLYWILCFVISFVLLYYGNHGVVRFFAVLGAAIGMLLYGKTVGRIYVKSVYRLIMLLLTPYRFLKIRLTRIANHFRIMIWNRMRMKRGEGEENATEPKKREKGKACFSPQKK